MSSFLDLREQLLQGELQKQAEKDKAARHVKAVEEYLKANEQRVRDWYKRNPGKIPPVFYIAKEDRVVWLTREQLRKLKRMRQRERDALGLSNPLRTRAQDHLAKNSSSIQPGPARPPKEADDETSAAGTTSGGTNPGNERTAR